LGILIFISPIFNSKLNAQSETKYFRKNNTLYGIVTKVEAEKYNCFLYDNKNQAIAKYESKDETFFSGTLSMLENQKILSTHHFICQNFFIKDTTYFKTLGYSTPLKYLIQNDSSGYSVTKRFYGNRKLAYVLKTLRCFDTSDITYFAPDGRLLGTNNYSRDKDPSDGLVIKYYGNMYEDFPAIIREKIMRKNDRTEWKEYYDKKGNVLGKCMFRNDEPYDGRVLEPDLINTKYTLLTFQKGLKKGDVTEYDQNFNVINQYTLDESTGQIHALSTTSTGTKNQYKDGLPYHGKFVVEYAEIEYKDGKIHGLKKDFHFLTRDTYCITQYKQGLKQGSYLFTMIKNKKTFSGIYKNDKPYSGEFVVNQMRDYYIVNRYEEGEIVYAATLDLERDKNTGNITDYRLSYSCNYLNGKPFTGIIYNEKTLMYESYRNGLADGPFFTLNKKDTTFLKTYYLGELHGRATSKRIKCSSSIEGEYRNGKKYNGLFHDWPKDTIYEYRNYELSGIMECSYYFQQYFPIKDGKKHGKAIQRSVNNDTTKVYECMFENGIPIEGTWVQKYRIENYKNGKKHGYTSDYGLDEAKKNPLFKTWYQYGKKEHEVRYDVFEQNDSVITTFQNEEILNGIQYIDKYGMEHIRILNFKNGVMTGDSVHKYKNYNCLYYKNGRKWKGSELLYTGITGVYLNISNTYENYLLTSSKGGDFQTPSDYDMTCKNTLCIKKDKKYFPATTHIQTDTILNKKTVRTFVDQKEISFGTALNDTLEKGSFVFYNYDMKKNRLSHLDWEYAFIETKKDFTKITLKNNQSEIFMTYVMPYKITLPYPVYLLYNLENQLNDYRTVIEYYATTNGKKIGSYYRNQYGTQGVFMTPFKNQVKVEYWKNSDIIKEEYVSPEEIDKKDFPLKKDK
jgi:hypothetical protein